MNIRTYAIVTLCYWALMLTDGALRMLCLLHFHENGFTPDKLAFLFLLYEVAGVVTNLFGGWIASRFGLKTTLFVGLTLQAIALCSLTLLDHHWSLVASVAFVMLIQMLAGIAKDLTKMSSKSAVKLLKLAPKEPRRDDSTDTHNADGMLFKVVAFLTGSKNAIKGLGFFLGALLLQQTGYNTTLYILATIIALALIISLLTVRGDFGKTPQKVKIKSLFSKSQAINRLSIARAFLFASRDVWFVVGLPIFLLEQLGWNFEQIGGFMAAWVIGYGFIQSIAPKLTGKANTLSTSVSSLLFWAFALTAVCLALTLCIHFNLSPTISIIAGLFTFGFIFAINSSIHSYLILAYTSSQDVALNVGFYYMANACGRLIGTLLSGLTYLAAGLTATLATATILTLIAAILNTRLPKHIDTAESA